MSRNRPYLLLSTAICSCFLFACHSKQPAEEQETPTNVSTPVTVTAISHEPMTDYIELNATSSYLLKSLVKSNTNGYLVTGNPELGQTIERGQVLFSIKTKEATALGNTINTLDTSFHFSGTNNVKASSSGFIAQLDHKAGDYVQDGEQLAIIADKSSFVFLMDMPYELRPFVLSKNTIELLLPDGEMLTGRVDKAMPFMDSVTQTQRIIIRVNPSHTLPENLIAKARIVKNEKKTTISLPRNAVLTNETQTEFWIMKLTDSTTAIKVFIKKGMEAGGRIEITDPPLNDADKIVLTGNYGLADTAHITIQDK